MVVNLAEEFIEAFLSYERTQALVSCNFMDKRIVHIGYIDVVRQDDDNLIILCAPPAFGTPLSASGECIGLFLRPYNTDWGVGSCRQVGDTRFFGFGR